MSYKTVEVELHNGRVTPLDHEALPAKARAWLTFLPANGGLVRVSPDESASGLRRFVSAKDFPLTPEQFQTSMDTDFFEQ